MERDGEYLFVYGTLMRSAGHPMRKALMEKARFVSEGTLKAALYEIDGYPGAVDSREGLVRGEIYRIDENGTIFDILDRYEECSDDFPPPREFERTRRKVRGKKGEEYEAWVYLYRWSLKGKERIADGDYRKYLQRKKNGRK